MVFSNNLLMGAAAAASGGGTAYVPNGAMWVNGSDEYLSKTFSSVGSRSDFTISFWIKLVNTDLSSTSYILSAGDGTGNEEFAVAFLNTEILRIFSVSNGSTYQNFDLRTTQVFRDPTAWQHWVISFNNDTASPYSILRFWINGSEVTSYGTQTNPVSGELSYWTDDVAHNIGRTVQGSNYAPFYLSEFISLDGNAVTSPSDFGEYNSDGVWQPIDPSAYVTANKGTNGFWLDFADSSDLGNDVSGNNNDFTVNNIGTDNSSLDRCVDSDTTGNFNTFNRLMRRETNLLPPNGVYGPRGVVAVEDGGKLVKWTGGSSAGTYGVNCAINSSVPMYPGNKYHFEWKTTRWGSDTKAMSLLFLVPVSYYSYYTNINGSVNGSYTYYTSSWNPSRGITSGVWYNGTNIANLSAWPLNETLSLDIDMSTIASTVVVQKRYNSGSPTTDYTTSALTFLNEPYYVVSQCQGNGSGRDFDSLFNFGDTSFLITPETDHVGISTKTSVNQELGVTKPKNYFSPVLYEGNGISQRVGNFIPFTDSHTVGNSARFDSGDSNYLQKTFTSSEGAYWTFSCWYKPAGNTGSYRTLLQAGSASGSRQGIQIQDDSTGGGLDIYGSGGSNSGSAIMPVTVGRSDTWVNIVISWSNGAIKVYLDGVEQTLTTNTWGTGTSFIGTDTTHRIGTKFDASAQFLDGYLAEIVFVTGTGTGAVLTPSSFGQTDTSTNRWIPKDVSGLTFGTNGFYLNMADKNDLGDDESGQGNDFTMTNMDTTNGSNQMYDTPTRNTAVWDAGLTQSNVTLTKGNLKQAGVNTGNNNTWLPNAFIINQKDGGKYYWESTSANTNDSGTGVVTNDFDLTANMRTATTGNNWINTTEGTTDIRARFNNTYITCALGATFDFTNDRLCLALDASAYKLWMGWYDKSAGSTPTWFDSSGGGTGNPATGANPTYLLTGNSWRVGGSTNDSTAIITNFGQWIYYSGYATTEASSAKGYFSATPPTGFVALNQDNAASNTAGITGFVWNKDRDATENHYLFDRIRGVGQYISSNSNAVEVDSPNTLTRFLQDGCAIGSSLSNDGDSYVNWQWVGNGTGTSNSEGTNIVSTVSANTTAGFSIVKYTGTGTAGDSVGHGLGAVPKLILIKLYDTTAGTRNWSVYHVSVGNTAALRLDTTDTPQTSSAYFNDVTPTSTVFTLGTGGSDNSTNSNNKDYIAYVFSEVEGYSKFGAYYGNGSSDGTQVYLGFKPSFLMVKSIGTTAYWDILDSTRDTSNPVTKRLHPNTNESEATAGSTNCDFLAQGFKWRDTKANENASGINFIYAAFAENPFGGSNVAQAKAR